MPWTSLPNSMSLPVVKSEEIVAKSLVCDDNNALIVGPSNVMSWSQMRSVATITWLTCTLVALVSGGRACAAPPSSNWTGRDDNPSVSHTLAFTGTWTMVAALVSVLRTKICTSCSCGCSAWMSSTMNSCTLEKLASDHTRPPDGSVGLSWSYRAS